MKLDFDRLDPELAVILPALPPGLADIDRSNVVALRTSMAESPVAPVQTEVETREHAVSHDGVEVPLYVYRRPSDAIQPCILWIHGGGYIFGSAQDDRARGIAERLDCTVVSVDYRLAPEHPFPAGSEDCYAALLWVIENAAELCIDPTRVAVGGASAGGGMAAGLALMNRDRGGPELAMQLLGTMATSPAGTAEVVSAASTA